MLQVKAGLLVCIQLFLSKAQAEPKYYLIETETSSEEAPGVAVNSTGSKDYNITHSHESNKTESDESDETDESEEKDEIDKVLNSTKKESSNIHSLFRSKKIGTISSSKLSTKKCKGKEKKRRYIKGDPFCRNSATNCR